MQAFTFVLPGSTPEDRGRFALFMMMMFRPWRELDATVALWARDAWHSAQCDAIWEALFAEFVRWRGRLIADAFPYYAAGLPHLPAPVYNSKAWWTCLTYPKLHA